MSPAELLQEALVLLASWGPQSPGAAPRCVYRMGADLDGNPIGCDCSAFVARCHRGRKFDGRRWYNTDAIYADAQAAEPRRWRQIAEPVPGAIGVYPGRVRNGKRTAGHVWVIEDVPTCTTIECCSSGKGIKRMKRPAWFARGAVGNGKPILFAEYIGG